MAVATVPVTSVPCEACCPAADPLSLLGRDLGSFGMLLRATGLSSLPVNTAGSQLPRPIEASLMTGVVVWVIFQTTA